MSEHMHPNLKYKDGEMLVEFLSHSGNYDQNMNTVEYPYYQWPYFQWPCCLGSGHEQTMEIEINGQKVIIKGKDLKVKVEKVE